MSAGPLLVTSLMFWGGDNRRPISVTFSQLRAVYKNIGLVDGKKPYWHLGSYQNICPASGANIWA